MPHAPDVALLALDIGAKTHTYAGQFKQATQHGTVEASPAAIGKLIGHWLKRSGQLHVLVEATGIYYLDTALIASKRGATVSVINPKSAHNFAKALGQRNKTDRLDAAMLLEFLKRMPVALWERPSQRVLELRYFGRYLTQLTDERTAVCNRLHALQASAASPAAIRQDMVRAIATLDKRIDRIRAQAITLIASDEGLLKCFQALTSIKGVGENSAVSLLAELILLPRSMSARACVSHAGLDPCQRQSGTSVHTPARISKHGNKYLRRALYYPALSAGCHDPGAKALKERLVGAGKKGMQAQVAIMRKLLTVAWAMVCNPQPYDSAKLFHMI